MLESVPQLQPITYLPFHNKDFWDNFYKNLQDNSSINWYFDLTKIQLNDFSLANLKKDDEILILGAGLSSTLDYLYNNDFEIITIFDFSEELNKILTQKYQKDWDIEPLDITILDPYQCKFDGLFSVIIDKGCLDCILSDPENGEEKFVKALNNILIMLSIDKGVFYYFSNGKMEDRINLFYKVPKIKYKVATIDMNETMKEEYKEFNQSDNIYYLYTITKSE
jgi:hypothetical protein